jgi:hypothetical protein
VAPGSPPEILVARVPPGYDQRPVRERVGKSKRGSMTSARLLARVVAIGMIGGGASTLFSQIAHADDTLLAPLAGSDTAIILGGTFESTPSTSFAQSAEDLYLHPLGFDDGATYSTVCDMVGTDPCAAPLQVLTTPELIQQGPSSLTAADDVVLAVENEFNANQTLSAPRTR